MYFTKEIGIQKAKIKRRRTQAYSSRYFPITRVDVWKTNHQSRSAYERLPAQPDDDVRVPRSPFHTKHVEQRWPLVRSGGFLENGGIRSGGVRTHTDRQATKGPRAQTFVRERREAKRKRDRKPRMNIEREEPARLGHTKKKQRREPGSVGGHSRGRMEKREEVPQGSRVVYRKDCGSEKRRTGGIPLPWSPVVPLVHANESEER